MYYISFVYRDKKETQPECNIMYLTANGNCTKVRLIDGREVCVCMCIKQLLLRLNQSKFMRVHRKHAVNIDYFKHYDEKDNRFIVMLDNTKIKVSRRDADDVADFLTR